MSNSIRFEVNCLYTGTFLVDVGEVIPKRYYRFNIRDEMESVRVKIRAFLLVGVLLASGNMKAQVFEMADVGGKTSDGKSSEHAVVANGFWRNWFLQAGLDMSLQNPYGYDFADVFPNGKTFGLDLAVGKWFAPQVGARGKFNWENKLPLLKNDHANWLAPFNQPGVNRDKGGYIAFYGDLLLNMHNLLGTYRPDRTWTNVIAGYQEDKKWHTNAFVRAGIITQFEMGSGSPLMGAGIEQTYRLNERLNLYGDVGYQVTTSEGMGVSTTGMDVAAGSNGFFNLEMGIIVDLGKNIWQ